MTLVLTLKLSVVQPAFVFNSTLRCNRAHLVLSFVSDHIQIQRNLEKVTEETVPSSENS